MAEKMISNSDILIELFHKKEYRFLQEIDEKIDKLNDTKQELEEKENGIKNLFATSQIEEIKKEKVLEFVVNLKKDILDLEIRIKELNQAIIRLVVDKETYYKYQTQNVKQTVCFIKDKIEEYINLEKKFSKIFSNIDQKINHILEEKTESEEEKPQKNVKIEEKKSKKVIVDKTKEQFNQASKRRTRQGSALKELEEKMVIVQEEQQTASDKKEENVDGISENYNLDNNVLLISEKEGKVFLPYKKIDLQNYLLTYPQDYQNYQEVIEKEYILPLDSFMKNQTLSRFREMYELIRNRELKSMVEAMKLSTKFMFKYELNPAIIAACNTQEELDEYLKCLENNQLEDFQVFDIKFELNLL